MSQVVTLRLRDETAERLKRAARRAGRSVSEVGATSIEEWLRQNEFAEIEFRNVGGERLACLKGALPVWQLIQVAQSYEMDLDKTAAHFRWPKSRIVAAFNYYDAYPSEIDAAIEENRAITPERLKRILPSLHVTTV